MSLAEGAKDEAASAGLLERKYFEIKVDFLLDITGQKHFLKRLVIRSP